MFQNKICNTQIKKIKCTWFIWVFLAVPLGLWDLSSLTRDGTQALGRENTECNHWTIREFIKIYLGMPTN